jgi:hypothetical protein
VVYYNRRPQELQPAWLLNRKGDAVEIQENEGGGKSIILGEGDDLSKVPRSHRGLITPAIREAFADPPGYFRQLAQRCPFRKMAKWLRGLVLGGGWELHLNRGDPKEWTLAGFSWGSVMVRGATVGLPNHPVLDACPEAVKQYYQLVDEVLWMPFGCAGGLGGAGEPTPLTHFADNFRGDPIDPTETFAWGCSPCGDMVIYTAGGRGGWWCHENNHVHLLGTIEETLDWVYGELLAGRCPEFDYRWI